MLTCCATLLGSSPCTVMSTSFVSAFSIPLRGSTASVAKQAPHRLLPLQVSCRYCGTLGIHWGGGDLTVVCLHTGDHGLPHTSRKCCDRFQSGHRRGVSCGWLHRVKMQLLDHFFCHGSTFDKFILCTIKAWRFFQCRDLRNSQNFRVRILDQHRRRGGITGRLRRHDGAQ